MVEGLTSNCTKQSQASSGLWINRLISFLILMLLLTSPLIVILILLGKLKPENYCEKGEFEVETLLSFLPHYFCYLWFNFIFCP